MDNGGSHGGIANILTPGLGVVMIITLAAEDGWRRTLSGARGAARGRAFLVIAGTLSSLSSCPSTAGR